MDRRTIGLAAGSLLAAATLLVGAPVAAADSQAAANIKAAQQRLTEMGKTDQAANLDKALDQVGGTCPLETKLRLTSHHRP